MDALTAIAERRIQEAVARGDLDALPGRGRPLRLEDLSRVAPELRAGYLLLKGAGFGSAELEARKHALTLRDLLDACRDEPRRAELRRALRRAELRFELLAGRRADSPALAEYGDRLLQRLGGEA